MNRIKIVAVTKNKTFDDYILYIITLFYNGVLKTIGYYNKEDLNEKQLTQKLLYARM